MSNSISRPEAESAKRRAQQIGRLHGSPVYSPALESERRACVALWNEFCAAETARLAAPRFAQVLPGVYVWSR